MSRSKEGAKEFVHESGRDESATTRPQTLRCQPIMGVRFHIVFECCIDVKHRLEDMSERAFGDWPWARRTRVLLHAK